MTTVGCNSFSHEWDRVRPRADHAYYEKRDPKRCRARRFRHRAVWVCIVVVSIVIGCDSPPEERRSTIYELREDPTPENVVEIRSMLGDTDRDVRATALNTLVGLRVPDSMALTLSAIQDDEGFVRSIAAKLLGDLGDPEQTGVLVQRLLEDPDPWVRKTAAESLVMLGGDAAAGALVEGLSDPMETVRLASVSGLRKLDPGRATAALARLLLEDPSWEVRVQAAGALGISRDPDALPVLEAVLDDDNEFVRSAAANAIRRHEALAGGSNRQESPRE